MIHPALPDPRPYFAAQAKNARRRKILLVVSAIFSIVFVGLLVAPLYH
ncbi:MAG: hypothetical protein KGH79_01155 [Patescibacteria group bacterium]|nr:hypothetical protein [Patescibacteria group bacterium]